VKIPVIIREDEEEQEQSKERSPQRKTLTDYQFIPNMDLWEMSLHHLFSWIYQSQSTPEIFFMATRLLPCVISKYAKFRQDNKETRTRDKETQDYIVGVAACAELCSLFITGDSLQDNIHLSIPNVSLPNLHKAVSQVLYMVDANVQPPNAFYMLESILTNPKIVPFDKQKDRKDYVNLLCYIQTTPMFFQLSDVQQAALAVYIIDGVKVTDDVDNKEVLDFVEAKSRLLLEAARRPKSFMLPHVQKYLT
jgi:hypothetical protein